jgi:hypothetical protein
MILLKKFSASSPFNLLANSVGSICENSFNKYGINETPPVRYAVAAGTSIFLKPQPIKRIHLTDFKSFMVSSLTFEPNFLCLANFSIIDSNKAAFASS